MKKLLLILIFILNASSHPVSYTIDLKLTYNKENKIATINCKSISRNKCGLHDFKLLDEKNNIISIHKFPFLKKEIIIKTNIQAKKINFYLRKIPEHKYVVLF